MNVLMLLTPKSEVCCLTDGCTLRQGLEKMRARGYTAVPVIAKDGRYAGSVNEGDFLRYIAAHAAEGDLVKLLESARLGEVLRPDYNPAVTVGVEMDALVRRAENQNFIPVTDDRGTFIGIVTRKRLIECLANQSKQSKQAEREERGVQSGAKEGPAARLTRRLPGAERRTV